MTEKFEPPIHHASVLTLDYLDQNGATFSLEDSSIRVTMSREVWDSLGSPSRITNHAHENVLRQTGYDSELDFKRYS